MEVTTYPLHSISLEEAKALQFKIIDVITRHFDGREVLSLGDLGVVPGLNKPTTTKKVEEVIAEVFGAERAQLVWGSGTGALRWALMSTVKPGDAILVHKAPIYPTTQASVESMSLRPIRADYNDPASIAAVIAAHKDEIKGVLVQHTRQKIDDRYDLETVITQIKSLLPDVPVVTDDNYAALKVKKIGCQAGADLASFSCFKTLGPEGVGVVIGKKKYVDRVENASTPAAARSRAIRPWRCCGASSTPPWPWPSSPKSMRSWWSASTPARCRRQAGLPGQRPEQGAAGGVRHRLAPPRC